MKDRNLLLFNLRTDSEDDILGFTTDWINELARHFTMVFVITMFAGRIQVAENVQVFSVGREKGYSKARRFFVFYRLLWRLLRRERIDACFAHMIQIFAVMAWPLLKLRRIPLVLWYAHKTVNPTLKIAVRLVDRVVVSSKSGFQIETNKLRIIGQGIDTQRFTPPKQQKVSNTFTILSLGRISPIKRVELLIEALGMLRERSPGCKVMAYIVGGPLSAKDLEYSDTLKALSVSLKVDDWLVFAGSSSFREVHSYYQDADCFVNSSDTDSVDKTVLEAMSCGIPIITSNIAFKDILDSDLAEKWIIDKGKPEAVYERLQTLITMALSERRALGRRLRNCVVAQHSLPLLAEKLIDVIEDI